MSYLTATCGINRINRDEEVHGHFVMAEKSVEVNCGVAE